MKLEHCQKCKKQIEFFEKDKDNVHDDKKSEMNKLEASKRSESCTVNTHWFCDKCWFDAGTLLQNHGYLPKGMDGFMGDSDDC